jgi:hypothetical protein
MLLQRIRIDPLPVQWPFSSVEHLDLAPMSSSSQG